MLKKFTRRITLLDIIAGSLVFADWSKVFPGALILWGNPACASIAVSGLSLAMYLIEHELARTFRPRCPHENRWLLAATFSITFGIFLGLAAIGAGHALGDVLLFRVADRNAAAIWAVILGAKGVPLFLLIAEARARKSRKSSPPTSSLT